MNVSALHQRISEHLGRLRTPLHKLTAAATAVTLSVLLHIGGSSFVHAEELPPTAPTVQATERGRDNLEEILDEALTGPRPPEARGNYDASWQRLKYVLELILDQYADPIAPEELERRAIRAMIRQLDEHSVYMTAEEWQQFSEESIEFGYGGIGIVVQKEDDGLHIRQVMPGSPAERAGLQVGDVITMVDGTHVQPLSLEEAGQLMRGSAGTRVDIVFQRPGETTLWRRIIERDVIKTDETESRMVDENIGYIRLPTFGRSTGDEFRSAYTRLLREGAQGLVLDLRDNTGGHVISAIEVARELIPSGPIMHILRADGTMAPIEATPGEQQIPVAVLINGWTASASEMLAGAVQDSEVGILVGEQSYGKASVQRLYELDNGDFIKMTIAHVLTPKQRDIDGEGLTPDIPVMLPGNPVNDASDLQLQAAIDWLRQQQTE